MGCSCGTHKQALLEFVFIVFACITLLIGINAAKSKAAGRVLFPATFVTGIASISYFSMASGGGWVIAPDCRQLFVARYMDWLITTPLLLIDLGIVAGVSRWDIMALCLSDSEWTLLGLTRSFLPLLAACFLHAPRGRHCVRRSHARHTCSTQRAQQAASDGKPPPTAA